MAQWQDGEVVYATTMHAGEHVVSGKVIWSDSWGGYATVSGVLGSNGPYDTICSARLALAEELQDELDDIAGPVGAL